MEGRAPQLMAWTTGDIPDQAGRRAVVTGANSGIGYETAKALAEAGADVVLAVRSEEKGGEALAKIESGNPKGTVRVERLDLASLASVEACADRLLAEDRPVDLLINNAGVMAIPKRHTTEDGFEMQLGTNFLGHFALTGRLLPLLQKGEATRVVSISSGAHRVPVAGRIRFDDLQSSRRYQAWLAYGQSKLAMLLFARELDRRSRQAGWGILSNAAHPGYARTNLQTAGSSYDGRGLQARAMEAINRLPFVSQSQDHGALPTLMAATDPGAVGGDYYGPTGPFEMTGPPGPARIARQGRNDADAARLWTAAEGLTGVRFG